MTFFKITSVVVVFTALFTYGWLHLHEAEPQIPQAPSQNSVALNLANVMSDTRNTAPTSTKPSSTNPLGKPQTVANQNFDPIDQQTVPNSQFTKDVRFLATHRPEVLHLLQNKFTEPSIQQHAIKGVALLQRHLINPIDSGEEVLKQYDCMTLPLTQSDQTLLKFLVFDTPEREQILQQSRTNSKENLVFNIPIDDEKNAVNPCTP